MATPNVQSISGSILPIVLLQPKPSRTEAIIQNDSSSPLYVAFGDKASPVKYTTKLYTDDVLTTTYHGLITGIWGAATGSARVTEL